MKRAFKGGAPKERTVRVMTGGAIESIQRPVIIRKTPVVWGIPCDEIMYSKFFQYFIKHANYMPWDGWCFTEDTYLPKARNFIHNAFLLESTMPYLLMVDSDIVFPPDLVDRLMAHNLPIVGGWYKDKKKDSHPPVVFDFVPGDDDYLHVVPRQKGNGLERVEAMGTGNWLMKREVAEALGESPYSLNRGGEDLEICWKLKQLGIPLHVDWDIALAHVGVGVY